MTALACPKDHDDIPVEVHLKDVERVLLGQLKESQGPGELPVVTARMSNLIIYCDSAQRADLLLSIVPDIVAIHPARVLMLLAEPDPDETGALRASVCVRTHKIGKGLRAVSDQITLHGAGRAVDHFPFVVRQLAIGDLPTNLLWAGSQPPALATGGLLNDMAESAQQVVYDSLGWPEPARGLAATATWIERFERTDPGEGWRVASDLNWRRLKTWRRILTQALDPATPGHPGAITGVDFDHGPHSIMIAWTLASWLTLRLGWTVRGVRVRPNVEMDLQFDSPQGERHMHIRRVAGGPIGIHRIRMACDFDGTPGALVVQPDGENRLAVVPEGIGGVPRTITMQEKTLADLIGRQLSDREHDPVFRQTLAVAQALARKVVG